MANASNLTVPFLRDFKMTDLTTVSFKLTTNTANGAQTAEASIPIIHVGATPHQVLCCPHEFKRAKAILKWTTGPKPFKAFQFVPEDPRDVDCWDGLCSRESNQRSVDESNELLRECIDRKFDEDAKVCRNHKRCLTNLKKPKALKV